MAATRNSTQAAIAGGHPSTSNFHVVVCRGHDRVEMLIEVEPKISRKLKITSKWLGPLLRVELATPPRSW